MGRYFFIAGGAIILGTAASIKSGIRSEAAESAMDWMIIAGLAMIVISFFTMKKRG